MDDVLITLVPCDAAVENGKWNLVGVFDRWLCKEEPYAVNPFNVLVRAQGVPLNEEFELAFQLVKTELGDDGADFKLAWKFAHKFKLDGAPEDHPVRALTFNLLVADIKAAVAHPIVLGELGVWELQAFYQGLLRGTILIPAIKLDDGGVL